MDNNAPAAAIFGEEQKQGSIHEKHMQAAIDLSKSAVRKGNHPFGALLVDPETNEVVLKAENSVHTGQDVTNHAELNLMREVQKHPKLMQRISKLTLYTSTEPCAMCSGSIWWTGVRSIVYGCSEKLLSEIVNTNPKLLGGGLNAGSRDILEKADNEVSITGPVLEQAAAQCHRDYWTKL